MNGTKDDRRKDDGGRSKVGRDSKKRRGEQKPGMSFFTFQNTSKGEKKGK
jgi:hypothetical protein